MLAGGEGVLPFVGLMMLGLGERKGFMNEGMKNK